MIPTHRYGVRRSFVLHGRWCQFPIRNGRRGGSLGRQVHKLLVDDAEANFLVDVHEKVVVAVIRLVLPNPQLLSVNAIGGIIEINLGLNSY